MKINLLGNFLGAVALALVAAPFSLSARAEDQKVGVVDMQRAIQTSEAGKKAKAELEGAFNKKKKELQAEEVALKKMQEDFQKQQAALSDASKKKKQTEMQERFMKYQELLQKSQSEIQGKEQEMSKPIIARIRTIVAEVAKKRSFSLILEKNENVVIFSEDKDDITDDVLKQLK